VIYIFGLVLASSLLLVKRLYGRTLQLGNLMNGLIFQVLLIGGQIIIRNLMPLDFVFQIEKLDINRHLIWFLLQARWISVHMVGFSHLKMICLLWTMILKLGLLWMRLGVLANDIRLDTKHSLSVPTNLYTNPGQL
jgi:hypothetical protein